jgi:uncharacterized protein (DUF2461 family)
MTAFAGIPFTGIPSDAFRFYADLEQNNNRDWWLEHRPVYEAAVKGPLTQLLAELEPGFGPAKLFRPNRDVRFSRTSHPIRPRKGPSRRWTKAWASTSSSAPTAS